MSDGFDTGSPNYLLGRLVTATEEQGRQLGLMSEKVDKLAHVPEKLDKMATEIHDLRRTQTTVTKHSVIIGLIGASILLGAPIMATWNFHLRAELNELHKTTTALEERIERNIR